MYFIDKKKTFLNDFDESSKITYDKLGKIKPIFWLFCYIITFLLFLVPEIFFSIVIQFFMIVTHTEEKLMPILQNPYGSMTGQWVVVSVTGVHILAFFIYIKCIERRPFKSIGFKGNEKIFKYLKGACIAVLMQLICWGIILIFGFGKIAPEAVHMTNALGLSAIGPVLIFLIAFLIQGASEEIAVRGWLLPVLARHYKPVIAIIFSSLFFGFMHASNPNVAVLPLINLVLYGIFAALYALYDDGLWGICAQHSIWNWFMGNVLGLPVSGMFLGQSSIIETSLTGPEWITGGGFGPEGGIIVTFIFTVASLILIKKLIHKGIIVKN
ncbi:MAG: CPBP family intramembrane metalloprotease [Epulopiscium sp.]|nr:CPBP family intramembrane metalloprotease [Candidatus Epulonipiscium sp.]